MRLYSTFSEETLQARKLLADWASEGFLTQEQCERLKLETVSELRTTNVFLRIVLFLFTLISVCAAAALFDSVFLHGSGEQADGIFLLICAPLSYAAAEIAVSQARLYRHGVEEALAVCSAGFLCLGMQFALFSGYHVLPASDAAQSLVPVAGAAFSLRIWRRFGLWYAFPAAMIFALFLGGYWTSSHWAQHAIVALLYTIGLAVMIAIRSRRPFNFADNTLSLSEAFLWLGIYLAVNIQLSALNLPLHWLTGSTGNVAEFAGAFYWTTWVLTWVLPPIVLVRGVQKKDRYVLGVGGIAAVLTFVTNKPYLGWPRHTWDPMLLGIVLTGVALFLRRWLAGGPNGVRGGFTASRMSGRDQIWLNAGSAAFGLVTPQSITPSPQPAKADFHFGGGASGGGGAGGDF